MESFEGRLLSEKSKVQKSICSTCGRPAFQMAGNSFYLLIFHFVVESSATLSARGDLGDHFWS